MALRDTPMASYDTTFDSITAVKLQNTSLIMWSGIYTTKVKGITIFVLGEKLSLDGKV